LRKVRPAASRTGITNPWGLKVDGPARRLRLPTACLTPALLLIFTAILFPVAGFCLAGSAPTAEKTTGADSSGVFSQSNDAGNPESRQDSAARSAVLDSLEAAGVKQPSVPRGQGPTFNVLKIIASILVVIGLLLLFLYLLRMVIYRPPGALSAGGQFEMLRQFHLGPKKSICLVRVCDRLFLLGVTESSITRLMEVEDPEEVAKIQAQLAEGPRVQGGQFREVYQGLIGKFKK